MVGRFALIVFIIFVYKSGDYSTKNNQQSIKKWYDVLLICKLALLEQSSELDYKNTAQI